MENKKKIIVFLLVFLLFFCFSCKQSIKKVNKIINDKIVCANDSTKFKNIKNNLLYKDSVDKIYIKVENIVITDNFNNLNDCQKMPFVFLNEIALKNDSIVGLESIIDTASFRRYNKYLYLDSKRVYYYETEKASYPSIYETDTKPEKINTFEYLKK